MLGMIQDFDLNEPPPVHRDNTAPVVPSSSAHRAANPISVQAFHDKNDEVDWSPRQISSNKKRKQVVQSVLANTHVGQLDFKKEYKPR